MHGNQNNKIYPYLWLQDHLLFIYSSSSSILLETRTASRYSDWLGPISAFVLTWPRIQWESVVFSKGIKQPARENDHAPPFSAKAKNYWSYTTTDPIRLHCVHGASPVLPPSLLRAQSYFLTKLLQASACVCTRNHPPPCTDRYVAVSTLRQEASYKQFLSCSTRQDGGVSWCHEQVTQVPAVPVSHLDCPSPVTQVPAVPVNHLDCPSPFMWYLEYGV